jgi:periplasmic copper chaperone A
MLQTMTWRSATLAAALLATPVLAHHDGDRFAAEAITVSHAWTVETSATAHAIEVFLTIDNEGEAPDRLVAASVRFADPAVFQAAVVGATARCR